MRGHGVFNRMAHREFVEHVCIVFGQIGDDEVGILQCSENLRSDHSGLGNLVGTCDFVFIAEGNFEDVREYFV
jgi:hypothetical protein